MTDIDFVQENESFNEPSTTTTINNSMSDDEEEEEENEIEKINLLASSPKTEVHFDDDEEQNEEESSEIFDDYKIENENENDQNLQVAVLNNYSNLINEDTNNPEIEANATKAADDEKIDMEVSNLVEIIIHEVSSEEHLNPNIDFDMDEEFHALTDEDKNSFRQSFYNDVVEAPQNHHETENEHIEIPIHIIKKMSQAFEEVEEKDLIKDENVSDENDNDAKLIANNEDDEEMQQPNEIQANKTFNNDETFRALSLYLNYDFEASKHLPPPLETHNEEEYEEDSFIMDSSDNHHHQQSSFEGAPYCKFIDDEPGVSQEAEKPAGPQEVLQTVLIPCLYGYLKDYGTAVENNDDEGSNQSQKASEAESRADLLDKLNSELILDRKSWRLRSKFAEECLNLCRERKISPEQVNHIICCFALTFMDDSIDGVRKAGAELLAEIFSIFIENEWPSMMLHDSIAAEPAIILDSMPLTKALLIDSRRSFLKSNSWRRRQTWANVLDFLTKNFQITLQQYFFIFFDDIIAIANDKIRNTRRKFCVIFESIIENRGDEPTLNELFPSIYSTLRNIVEKMAKFDEDFEIQNQAQILVGQFNPATDYLDYDNYHNQVTEKEEKMWKKLSIITGNYIDDPKYIIKEFDSFKTPSIDEA